MTLRDDLHRVADDADLQPIAMAGVRAKARALRRRRVSAAVGGTVVGVAAIAAAAVLLVPGGADDGQPLPATRTPSPTATTSATAPVSPSSPGITRSMTVDLTNPPVEKTTGASFSVPTWIGGQLMDAQGDVITITSPVYGAVRDPSSGDWFGMTFAHGEWTWNQWTSAGKQLATTPAPSARVAITPDGRTWAVMVTQGGSPAIEVFHAGRQAPTVTTLSLPSGEPGNGAGVDGILPNGDVVFEGDVGDVRVLQADGAIAPLPGAFPSVIAVSPNGRMVVQSPHPLHPRDTGKQCESYVGEDGTGPELDCGATTNAYEFSGDGALVAKASGAAGRPVVQLISTGGNTMFPFIPAADFTFPAGTVVDTGDGAWIGDAFVVPVWSSGTWQVVWLSQDGYLITRSLSTPGSSTTSPYLFGAGPLTSPNP